MPTVSTFYGIKITMYFGDHPPPHFHVFIAEDEAKLSIDGGRLLAGALPKTGLRLVRLWARLHKSELEANWDRAMQDQPLHSIEGLK